MKMTAEKEEGGKLSSWKFYYAVLSRGFLLLYKDNYSKVKVIHIHMYIHRERAAMMNDTLY